MKSKVGRKIHNETPKEVIEELKKHLKNTPIEQLKKEWEEVKEFSNIGPNAFDYIKQLDHHETQTKTYKGISKI